MVPALAATYPLDPRLIPSLVSNPIIVGTIVKMEDPFCSSVMWCMLTYFHDFCFKGHDRHIFHLFSKCMCSENTHSAFNFWLIYVDSLSFSTKGITPSFIESVTSVYIWSTSWDQQMFRAKLAELWASKTSTQTRIKLPLPSRETKGKTQEFYHPLFELRLNTSDQLLVFLNSYREVRKRTKIPL